ncbi:MULTISPECIES: TetR/AcrR family transcriptional regulator [Amycolatopsis]|uniref:TetR/AcrR family transcriptional regulator n=1 Tax=Amycolatopsis TaxID=1813 RepID=UPI000F79D969|nr:MULTISPECIES: TetR/AcrR family transcriptional regulator [unclassified Amycolatopsis]QXV62874.1 TetR family transcriptional regulator [Amycolatopsis sp. TNS106]RSN60877.1 TetR family transcriptional regulator [Amycolatopsis sp. WAC 04182]
MPYRRTPKVQERLDAQRDAVLAAAMEQLAERGYAGCSVSAVAERAGVAVGSVYRHYPTKAALVVELFRKVVTREVEAVREVSERPGTPAERVVAVFDTFASRALKTPRMAYALLAEPVDAPIEAERLVFRRAFRDVVAQHVADGVRSGVLPAQDADVTAAALVGAAAEVLIGPLTTGSADEVSGLRTFVLRSLGGSDAEHS